MNTPLSLDEVRRFVPNAWVGKYSDLRKYVSKHGRLPLPLVVLYEVMPDYGHWVAVLETPEGIEHFDSYGILPDNELKWVPEWLKHSTGQDMKFILSELLKSNKKINYNSHRFQGKTSSTCGRWAALRIMFSNLGTDQFAQMVRNTSKQLGMSPDRMVSIGLS